MRLIFVLFAVLNLARVTGNSVNSTGDNADAVGTEEETGVETGEGTGVETGEGTGVETGEGTGVETGEGTGVETGEGTGVGTTEGTGVGTTEGTGVETTEGTGVETGVETGEGTGVGTEVGEELENITETALINVTKDANSTNNTFGDFANNIWTGIRAVLQKRLEKNEPLHFFRKISSYMNSGGDSIFGNRLYDAPYSVLSYNDFEEFDAEVYGYIPFFSHTKKWNDIRRERGKILMSISNSNLMKSFRNLIPYPEFKHCQDEEHSSKFLDDLITDVDQMSLNDFPLRCWKIEENDVLIMNQAVIVATAFRLWSKSISMGIIECLEDKWDFLIKFKTGEPNHLVTFQDEKPVIELTFPHTAENITSRIHIVQAIAHSIGHVFGLPDDPVPTNFSIMSPTPPIENHFILGTRIERELKKRMGHCYVKFKFIIDLINFESIGAISYQTLFVGETHLWMYDNALQSSNSSQLPLSAFGNRKFEDVDGYLNIYLSEESSQHLFLFKGDTVIKYNNRYNRTYHSMKDFKCVRKPEKITNTFYSIKNNRVYLFIDAQVWEYDYENFMEMSCPLKVVPFNELFITNYKEKFFDGVDHVYLSLYYRTLFFFKNDELYEVKDVLYDVENENYLMSLDYLGMWWNTFPDVCYTEPMDLRLD